MPELSLPSQRLDRPIADQVATWLLVVAAVVAPTLLGASGIWTRWALESTITAAVVLWCLSKPRAWVLTMLPLVAVGIGLLQVVPLPDWLLVRLAPMSAGAWKVVLAGTHPGSGCISVDPGATLTAARRLLLTLATVGVVADLGRAHQLRAVLMRAVAASGTLILLAGAIFGRGREDFTMLSGQITLRGPMHPLHSPLITPAQGAGLGMIDPVSVGSVQYLVDSCRIGDGCGFYIYSNHFAGGVAMTLPVLMSVWMGFANRSLSSVAARVGACVVGCVGVWAVGWLAGSWGGLATLTVVGLVFAALVAVSPLPKRIFAWIFIATSITTLILATVFLGPWQDEVITALPQRGQQIARKIIAANGRMTATVIGLRMFRTSPVLGTGLNTYQSIFPRFYPDKFTFFFAHSDWAQLLAESGLVGALTALVSVGVFFRRGLRFYHEAEPSQRTMDAGIWAALAGIVFYSALDWNLHLPANALLASIIVGLAVSSLPSQAATKLPRPLWPALASQGVLVLSVAVAFGYLTRDACSEAVQRALSGAIVADRIATTKRDAPPATPLLSAAIAAGQSAAAVDHGNARLQALMGQALLHMAEHIQDPLPQVEIKRQADGWFAKAQRASAVCRGIPEPKAVPR